MPSQLEEITATILRETPFRWDDVAVHEAKLEGVSKPTASKPEKKEEPQANVASGENGTARDGSNPALLHAIHSIGRGVRRRRNLFTEPSGSAGGVAIVSPEASPLPSSEASTLADPFDSLSAIPNGNNSDSPPAYFKLKGPSEPDDLEPHLTYRFYGRWVTHERHGRQFHFQTFVRCQPHSRAGVVKYLAAAPNIGQVVAQKLWDKFGSDAVRIAREEPEVAAAAVRAAGVNSFTAERAAEAATYLAGDCRLESCTLELMDLLAGHGFHKTLPKALIAKFGNRAPEIVRANPYILLGMKGQGCGFLKVDRLYLSLGLPAHKLKRQALCARHALVSANKEGHTWLMLQVAVNELTAKIGGAHPDPPRALRLAKRAGLIATRRDEMNRIWLALDSSARDEERIALAVHDSLRETASWPELSAAAPGEAGLSPHQATTFSACRSSTVAILGGGPGTGKSFTTARLVRAIQSTSGGSIAVAAPTGKAAVRISELMSAYGLSIRASTIHSLLGVVSKDDGFQFNHGPGNPLPFDWLILDEASMIDVPLFASFLAARAAGAHLLLVGDVNQLPPVGHGAPLRDLIAAGLPYGELKEIRRNSGTIVRACKDIREGRRFSVDEVLDLPPWPLASHSDDTAENPHPAKNLKILKADNPAAQIDLMLRALGAARTEGQNPIWDCQVLAAVNSKGDLSRKKLNEILQRELNKTGEKKGSNPFLVGDKIVNTKNARFPLTDGYHTWLKENCSAGATVNAYGSTVYPLPDGGTVEVDDKGRVASANGELAEVMAVEDKFTIARLAAPRREIVIPRGGVKEDENGKGGKNSQGKNRRDNPRDSDDDDDDSEGGDEEETKASSATGCKWDLGYCLSTHKSQGSEFPTTIIMLDDSGPARRVGSREWIYTAISRAKRACLLIGQRSTADEMCRRVSITRRKTFLVERIAELKKSGEGAEGPGEEATTLAVPMIASD